MSPTIEKRLRYLEGQVSRLSRSAEDRVCDSVIKAACIHFQLTPEGITKRCHEWRFVWPRYVCYQILREQGQTLTAISKLFGARNHTTVMHGLKRCHDETTVNRRAMADLNKTREIFRMMNQQILS